MSHNNKEGKRLRLENLKVVKNIWYDFDKGIKMQE